MNTNLDHNSLVQLLFNKLFLCESSKVSLSILRRAPKVEDLIKPPVRAMGTFRDITGVTRTEHNPNEQALIDLVYGISRESVGEEYFNQCGVNAYEFANLTIVQIAEIIYNEGTISLVVPKDAVEIYNLISQYLTLLGNAVMLNPHYKAPPEEDIKMLQHVNALIERVAAKFTPNGSGNGAFDQLLGLTKGSSVNALANVREKIVLTNLDHLSEQTLNTSPHLYQFSNRDKF